MASPHDKEEPRRSDHQEHEQTENSELVHRPIEGPFKRGEVSEQKIETCKILDFDWQILPA